MNIDWSKKVTPAAKQDKQRAQKQAEAKFEATRRIESRWDKVGQANVALGLYTEQERADCVHWINSHRQALDALMVRSDLVDLIISDDAYWPASEGA